MKLTDTQATFLFYALINFIATLIKLGMASVERFPPDKKKLISNFQNSTVTEFVAIAIFLPAYIVYILRYIYAKQVDAVIDFVANAFEFQPYVAYKKYKSNKLKDH